MAAEVTIQYNPYLPQLNILIDGQMLSEYSQLTKFADEDIWKWHSNILEVLYSEVRQEFFIIFIGTDIDKEIMQYECEKNSYCIGFRNEPLTIRTPLQKRLGKLNQFIKGKGITAYQRTVLNMNFVVPSDFQKYTDDILSIDINNLFCATQIHILTTQEDKFEDKENAVLFILAPDKAAGKRQAEKYHSRHPVFLIYQGAENQLREVNDTCLIYECNFKDIISTIFECVLGFPLLFVLRKCVQSLPKEIRSNEMSGSTAVDPVISINVEKNIEVGKSNRIQIIVDPPTAVPPRVVFQTLDRTIATTDNLAVFGIKPGKTQLEAYVYGAKKPFQICELNIIRRNRIKKLILDEDELILGVGDTRQMHYDYSPVDADNVEKVIWKTSDEKIAVINSHGTLVCQTCGTCKILCIAENVSAICNCEIRPYLEAYQVDLGDCGTSKELQLVPMQEYELKVQAYPENSIDRNYTVTSSNYDIANVIGNKIVAKNTGTAMIEITSVSGRKKISFPVKVSKGKSFFKSLFGK